MNNEIKKEIQNNEMNNTMKIYRGVIENNISDKKDGRVQVRIFGIHTSDLSKEPTDYLAWAEVVQSNTFGLSSGIGLSSIPNIGTWVFVILDHNNPNMPIVIGAISGKSVNPADTSVGFNHPPIDQNSNPNNYIYPIDTRLGEEDINRLTRVEKLDESDDPTVHKKINDRRDIFTSIDTHEYLTDAINSSTENITIDVSQAEPISLSDKSTYPNNTVIETKSGHCLEIDDSPDNEKIRIFHNSGTYKDFRPDGSFTIKAISNLNATPSNNELNLETEHLIKADGSTDASIERVINHEILEGSLYKHIMCNVKEQIEGSIDKIIKGRVQQYIEGYLHEHIKGTVKRTIDDSLYELILSKVERQIDSTLNEHIKGAVTRQIDSTLNETTSGKCTEVYNTQNTDGGPHITLTAGRIDLNP